MSTPAAPVPEERPSPRTTTRLLADALAAGTITMEQFETAMDEMIELAEFMAEFEKASRVAAQPAPETPSTPATTSVAVPSEHLDRVRALLHSLDQHSTPTNTPGAA